MNPLLRMPKSYLSDFAQNVNFGCRDDVHTLYLHNSYVQKHHKTVKNKTVLYLSHFQHFPTLYDIFLTAVSTTLV